MALFFINKKLKESVYNSCLNRHEIERTIQNMIIHFFWERSFFCVQLWLYLKKPAKFVGLLFWESISKTSLFYIWYSIISLENLISRLSIIMISDMKCDIKIIVNLISITEISRSQTNLSFFIIGICDFKIFKVNNKMYWCLFQD